MKVLKNITLYKCDYCGKEYKREKNCIKHEDRCSSNPVNDRACFYCESIEKTKVNIYIDEYETTEKRETLYCKEVKTFLYPPSVEHKGNAYLQEDIGDGDVENNPMPTKCKHCPSFDEMFKLKV